MKKRTLALLLAVVMVFGLAACGGGSNTGADGETVLTFAYKQVNNDPLEKFFDEYDIIETFEAEHPGVKIELKPVSSTEGDYGTLMALQLSSLLSGAVITETVFGINGIGRLAVDAISGRDIPLLQGTVLFSTVLVVLGNLVADCLYTVLDPRIRKGA